MRSCSKLFLGEHDWTAFSAAQSDVESRVRNVNTCKISDGWDARGHCHLVEFTVSANGFLRYMVLRWLGRCWRLAELKSINQQLRVRLVKAIDRLPEPRRRPMD